MLDERKGGDLIIIGHYSAEFVNGAVMDGILVFGNINGLIAGKWELYGSEVLDCSHLIPNAIYFLLILGVKNFVIIIEPNLASFLPFSIL